MSGALDLQLVFALAIVLVALALFGMHLFSSLRSAGLMISESKVPRRYLVLGVIAGLGILYMARQ